MFLGISNICWNSENDEDVYRFMKENGYDGLEIAPTRLFSESPYDNFHTAEVWSKNLRKKYGFLVSSMQSIWYGRKENIFDGEESRRLLLNYTKKAIDFARVIGCGNIVFGCPKNRNMPEGADRGIAVDFFRELGDYAACNGTVIGMEANPSIYYTNYINDTQSALQLVRRVDSRGFRLTLDIGTMVQNKEVISEIRGNVHFINHVHISEPYLNLIEPRGLHREVFEILKEENFKGCVSIEMKKVDIETLLKKIQYVRGLYESVL